MRDPIHPGETLREDLDAIGMSAAELARRIEVPVNRITEILNGRRAVTGDTALRLGRFFGTSGEFWLDLQKLYELRLAEQKNGVAIERIREFWNAQPFRLSFDTSKSLRAIFRDLLQQVEKRQRQTPGATYAGTVIQHLVGAKLDIVLGGITHHGASEADEGTGRDADFLLGDVAIHVTTAPGEALIRKCGRNLANSIKPLIVTTAEGLAVAQGLARQAGVADRIDVLDIEQFLTCNLYQHGRFESSGRRKMAKDLVASYNRLVSDYEGEPSLHINLGV